MLAYVLVKIIYATFIYFEAKVDQIKSMLNSSDVNEKYISYESKYGELL